MQNSLRSIFAAFIVAFASVHAIAQSDLPEPGPPRPFVVPDVVEAKLPNGLTVATVQRSNVPLVTVRLMIRSGASEESGEKAGLADLTAALMTKRTRTRTADQIAEQMEFLGGSLVSGADWNKTVFTFTVASDKLDAAMAILGDVILNSTLDAKELELIRSQALDTLAADLKEPAFLANYAASRFSFGEHPPGGTPESLKSIRRSDIARFRSVKYRPDNSVLVLVGDVDGKRAKSVGARFLGAWRSAIGRTIKIKGATNTKVDQRDNGNARILVVDLPDSGQSAVTYSRAIRNSGRVVCLLPFECESNPIFHPASVANSVLGGGYSSRLNQEIRIKRGLSYGAGSGFSWRGSKTNFSTRTQTKDESAAEVARIVVDEISKLGNSDAAEAELAARKLVINGDYSREFETTADLAETVSVVYSFALSTSEMKSFAASINAVTAADVRKFAADYLLNGDIVIAGDYRKFKDDLAKRFPGASVRVIEAARLDLSRDSLEK